MRDTEEEEEDDKAESENKDETEDGNDGETGDEEAGSQSSSKSWSTAPNTAKSKKILRDIGTGRENAPRPGINKEIPQRPRIKKEIPQRPRINKELPQRPRIKKEIPQRPSMNKEIPHIPRTAILAEEMKGLAKPIQSGVDGKPAIYELWKSVVVENKDMGIATFDIGPRLPTKQERVLMIVGQTGAGKTTMINSLANYVYGVQWKDNFRFKIITEKGDVKADDRAHSQTKGITAYSFNWKEGMAIPYTLTVIDTPGFGDSEGLHRDEELVVKMREFFDLCEPCGLKSVNAVGIVLPASTPRLTAAQKYIFHAITQLFAIDTKEKFVLLVSFCDGQEPAVIAVIKKAKLHYQKYHTFNNSAMFACNRDPIQKLFWDMGLRSIKAFLESLNTMEPVGLAMTKEVLVERRSLTETLKKLQEQIPRATSKIHGLQEKCRQLTEVREEVAKVVDVAEKRVKTHLEQERAINCNDCKKTTCEYPATHLKQKDIKYSKCMIPNEQKRIICGKCGCSWRSHCLEAKRYEVKSVYRHKGQENAVGVTHQVKRKVNLEKDVKALTTDIKKNQVELFARIQQAHNITVRLKEIALNPNPLTLEEYIDFLIEAEKMDAQDGFKKRIEHLEQAKRASTLCRKILNENGSAEAIMPDVMTMLEKENIDFETLDVVETPVVTIDQPSSMVETLRALFNSIVRKNTKKTKFVT
ncbi:unnamed protein product [Darwinula stevensoni]|uniref:Septin-type G domain-containing protein n=1 Tax=Darwinula stevensoni TaxID=69355 RepID=A0A7R9FQE9_9CRUS|nr:unnamed protein product [Darwinula stevensoni]CAG0899608.1 unnamed protein product [Darwinula stevensoni]